MMTGYDFFASRSDDCGDLLHTLSVVTVSEIIIINHIVTIISIIIKLFTQTEKIYVSFLYMCKIIMA